MTTRKTLALNPEAASDTASKLNKKGRGWKISDARLDELHAQARERRRFSSEAHKALARRFAEANLGRHKFTRHAVVGSAILDFNCHSLGMAIDIFEEGDNEALADGSEHLAQAGLRAFDPWQLHCGPGQIAMGRHDPEVVRTRRPGRGGNVNLPGQAVI